MRAYAEGYCFRGPKGTDGSVYSTRKGAAEAAIKHALGSRWNPHIDADTKRRLWSSLRAAGWHLTEGRL